VKFSTVAFSLFILLFIACQQKRLAEAPSAIQKEFILDSLLNIPNESALIEKYGERSISRDTLSYAERKGYPATVLFAGTEKEAYFTWNDSINMSGLNAVIVRQVNSAWATTEGITTGTSLSRLAELNEKELQFTPPGGSLSDGMVFWDGGLLQNRGLRIKLSLRKGYDHNMSLDSISREQRISSDWAMARNINAVVSELSLLKEHE
jgi:hypothetical protein